MEDTKDYGNTGLTIRAAFVDQVRRYPNKHERPNSLLWNGRHIVTADSMLVPNSGIVKGEILSVATSVEQGFDMDVDGGFQIENAKWVHPLRTWYDSKLESSVQYEFRSNNGVLWIWNVYKMQYPSGRSIEERWTENAGMWVERLTSSERVYHCSHGMANPPDFECLVFKITIHDRT